MDVDRFNVILQGTTLPGHVLDAVAEALAMLIKRDADFARKLLRGRPIRLKTGVDALLGGRYIAALEAIGASAVLESETLEVDADLSGRIAGEVLQMALQGQVASPAPVSHGDGTESPATRETGSLAVPQISIWNPNVAANWSFFFTPAFGSYVQMLNWRALGRKAEAENAQHWFVASVAMLFFYASVPLFVNMSSTETKGVALAYLFIWYLIEGKCQSAYVKREIADRFTRKSWGKPILIAAVGSIGFGIVAAFIGIILGTVAPSLLVHTARLHAAPPHIQGNSASTTVAVEPKNPFDDPKYDGTNGNPYADPNNDGKPPHT